MFFVVFVVAGCSKENTTNSELLTTTKDLYGFEAMSSITLLDGMDSNDQQGSLSVKSFSYTFSKLGYEDEVTEEENAQKGIKIEIQDETKNLK